MDACTPTFNALIEPHPEEVIVKKETVTNATNSTDTSQIFSPPVCVTRQNAVIDLDAELPETPFSQTITKRQPRRPIKANPNVTFVPTNCDGQREINFNQPVAPMYEDPLAILQALGAAFAVGAFTATLLCYAFSKPSVLEIIEA